MNGFGVSLFDGCKAHARRVEQCWDAALGWHHLSPSATDRWLRWDLMLYWEGVRTVFQGCCKVDQSTHYIIKIDKAVLRPAVPIGPAHRELLSF